MTKEQKSVIKQAMKALGRAQQQIESLYQILMNLCNDPEMIGRLDKILDQTDEVEISLDVLANWE